MTRFRVSILVLVLTITVGVVFAMFEQALSAVSVETAETVQWKFTADSGKPLSLTRTAEKLSPSAICRLVSTAGGYRGRTEDESGASEWISVPEPSRVRYFGKDDGLRRWMKHCGPVFSGVPSALPLIEL